MDQPQGPSSFDDLDLGSLLGDLPSLHSGQIAQLPDLGEEINVFGSSAQQQGLAAPSLLGLELLGADPLAQSSSSLAPAASPQQQSPVEQPAARRRGRGRQPKDSSQLTEKQLAKREANRRFEERQRQRRQEAEQQLEATTAELEQQRAQHEAARVTNATFDSMLQTKDELLGALQAAQQLELHKGFLISPAFVEVIKKHRVLEDYSAEELLRYSVTGHEDHLDEHGRVVKAPPFEAVAKDYASIVEELEGILGAARRAAPSGSASGGGGVAVAAAGRGTARESAPGEVVELSSRENSASLGPGAAAPSAPCCATLVSRGEAAPPPAGASALQEAAGPVSSSNQYPTIEALLAAGFRVRDRVVTLEELDQGLEVQDGPDFYSFTGPQMRQMTVALTRVGLLGWQQFLLFSENADRLMVMNMQTCTLEEGEQMELPHWQGVLAQLHLRPEQLKEVAQRHQEFMKQARPGLREWHGMLQRLRTLQHLPMDAPGSWTQREHAQLVLSLSECSAALEHANSVLSSVTAAFTSDFFELLDFPLQEAKLMTLSWPFFPQVHLLGVAAAVELGLDMELYDAFARDMFNAGFSGGGGQQGGSGAGASAGAAAAGAAAGG